MSTRSVRKKVIRSSEIGEGFAAKRPIATPSEPQLWANLAGIAEQSIAFWESFLDLRKSGKVALTSADRVNLLKIIRAVSWVESKHGTAGANQPARDPMQIGNPGDPGWQQFAGVLTKKDRYVRGDKFTKNYWADELPVAVAPEISFPTSARLTLLADATDGHRDPAFNPTMSIYWGVPHLIYKTNVQAAGRPAYLFAALNRAELVAGAVAYNGGGDPTYEAQVEKALADQGWPIEVESGFEGLALPDNISLSSRDSDLRSTQGLQLLRDVYYDISKSGFVVHREQTLAKGLNHFKFKLELTNVGSLEIELSSKPEADERGEGVVISRETDDFLFAQRVLPTLDIGDLDLSGAAKTGAESLKTQFGQIIVFTSGRRTVASQSKAMAQNIVSTADRKWIQKTYAASPERTELQGWVDRNPQATSVAQIQAGLSAIMDNWDDSQRLKISRHFAGLAFDMKPVRGKDEEDIVKAIKALPTYRDFRDGENGVDVWHVEFV